MTPLIISFLVLVAVAAGVLFTWARTLSAMDADQALAPAPATVYQNAHLYWREIGQARDWDGLKAQLQRWQQLANPGWGEERIEEVARALNEAVFRFAQPSR